MCLLYNFVLCGGRNASFEFVDPSGGINKFLGTSIERVAV